MAQTLKFGNKTWATKVGSTLAYNDENGNYKPLPFNFTRSTSATRVNKEGLIEVVTNDRPRIDYKDTSDGVLLLEKAATNLITYSEDFSNSYWTKSGASVVSGFTSPSADSPLGAFKLVEGTNNGAHFINTPHELSINGTATTHIYAKKGERNAIKLSTNGVILAGCYANFDLLNGVVSASALCTATIKSFGDYYKCSFTYASNGATAPQSYLVLLKDATDSTFQSYQGDGTSGVYIFGAMLEQNSVASSYIPTQGSASTRVAETASGSGNSEVFNDSEGVLFANIKKHENGGTTQVIALSDGSTNNNIYLSLGSTPNLIAVEVLASGGQAGLSSTSTNQSNQNKFAVKYKQNDFALWINGFEIDTDNSGNTPVGLNKINFDFGQGSFDFYGKTKELGYYNTILTDLELETLTSYKSWTSMVNELNLNIIYNG